VSQAEDGIEPGRRFATEIREQPAALRRLLEHDGEIARVAATVRERDARLVRIVGHGSSDNAASFGVYAFGLLPRWTAMRDTITLTVTTGRRSMSGSTVIGLSQSGRTPDMVSTSGRARPARSPWRSRTTPRRRSPARPRRSCRSEPGASRLSPRPRPT
jgi:fructoselysine-6-P-deglycase FrlB-like protein